MSSVAEAYLTGSMRAQGGTRKVVRASLDIIGITWTEYPGLFTSVFVMRGNTDQWRQVEQWALDNSIPVTRRG